MILSKVFIMNKTKNNKGILNPLTLLVLMLSVFSHDAFSQNLKSHGFHERYDFGAKFQKRSIGKPTTSIKLNYQLPDSIVAGQEQSFEVSFSSAIQASGSLSIYYRADEGLDVTEKESLSFDFNGEEISTVVTFNAKNDGLYYLNLGVLQLDEDSKHLQARSFVIPIQVGFNEYMGEVSNTQSKASQKVTATNVSSSRKMIEMIAE